MAKLNENPQIELKTGSLKHIFKGGYSAVILVAHDISEVNEIAISMNKIADDNTYAQIELTIIAVNIQQEQHGIQKLFSKSLET